MKHNTIDCCKFISINLQDSIRVQMPFITKRIYYSYNIPFNKSRGSHAHIKSIECLIAIKGSFEIEIDDGNKKKEVLLNSPTIALVVPPGIWAKESMFSEDAICLVLASEKYSDVDYIRDYSLFLQYKKEF